MSSSSIDFDFQAYIERQSSPHGTRSEHHDTFGDYAFSSDLLVLRRLNRLKPVRVIASSAVRFWKSIQRNELLGQSVKVSRRQFPEIYDVTAECARTLDIAMPTVYVSRATGLNAGTYGTDDEAFIVLGSALVQILEPGELKFVIGHECGHLHNNHVVYRTAVSFLAHGVGRYLSWAVGPASLALQAWSRRAEITCDRAGLICCRSEEDALGAMVKLVTGSKELAKRVDIEDYMHQADTLDQGLGRFKELFSSHPYLPKRITALRAFAKSHYYRALLGQRGGDPLDEVDRLVEDLIQVI